MKKNRIFVIVIAVILVIHAAVLFCFIGTPPPRGQKNDVVPEKKVEKTPESPVPQQSEQGKTEQDKTVPVPSAPKTPARDDAAAYRLMRARRNLGRDFDYSYAVAGDIPAIPESVNATAGILINLNTRQVLWAKNPVKSVPIASMSKLMTELTAYEILLASNGKYTLDTMVPVSVAAYRIGGSQVYLDPKESFPVRDLFAATAVKSANDAAYLLAEFFGEGSADSFVMKMNRKAAELKMKGTKFCNPNGLPGKTPADDNISTPEDMAKLAEACLLYPQLIAWASTWRAPFRKPGEKGFILMQNHNHLVPGSPNHAAGVDGLKTGFIQRSGFCLTVSCIRNGHRLIGVVMGFPTYKERDRFVINLLNWGYRRADNPAQALLDDAKVPPPRRKPVRKPAAKIRKKKKARR